MSAGRTLAHQFNLPGTRRLRLRLSPEFPRMVGGGPDLPSDDPGQYHFADCRHASGRRNHPDLCQRLRLFQRHNHPAQRGHRPHRQPELGAGDELRDPRDLDASADQHRLWPGDEGSGLGVDLYGQLVGLLGHVWVVLSIHDADALLDRRPADVSVDWTEHGRGRPRDATVLNIGPLLEGETAIVSGMFFSQPGGFYSFSTAIVIASFGDTLS